MHRPCRHWIASILIIVSMSATTGYAAPPLVNFQGFLADSTGQAVDDGVYALKFRIYGDSVGGAAIWETSGFVPLQTTGGIFNHLLGSTNTLPDSVFQNDYLWVGVTVNLDSETSPRTRLAAVPFAMQANRADTAAVALNKTTNAGELTAGVLATDRFSAFADLLSEGRIGVDTGAVAPGLHVHSAFSLANSIVRVENTDSISVALPFGTAQTSIKQLFVPAGLIGDFFRVSCAFAMTPATPNSANGSFLFKVEDFQVSQQGYDYLVIESTWLRVFQNRWQGAVHLTWWDTAGIGSTSYPAVNDDLDLSNGLLIELFGANTDVVNVTVHAGNLFLEYDVD